MKAFSQDGKTDFFIRIVPEIGNGRLACSERKEYHINPAVKTSIRSGFHLKSPQFSHFRRKFTSDPVSMSSSSPQLLPSSWQKQLAQAIREPDQLLSELGLKPNQSDSENGSGQDLEVLSAPSFPVMVPRSFLNRMEMGNRLDPLLLQVLPLQQEQKSLASYSPDPLQEAEFRPVPGVLHKYPGRVLLIAARSCAVNCRYCFRREYPYQQEPSRLEDWEPALEYLRQDESIEEVLLSGGDPLMLTDTRLRQLYQLLAAIPHLKRIRIHTRLPIVLPARVTEELLDLLTESRLRSIVVVHSNHPYEIVDDCAEALRKLVESGLMVLNQSVLLRRINDSTATLAELSKRLIDLGVRPYYLHQLDQVTGTAHFEVPIEEGIQLVEQLRTQLPGYAVPTYVQEQPGKLSKTPLS